MWSARNRACVFIYEAKYNCEFVTIEYESIVEFYVVNEQSIIPQLFVIFATKSDFGLEQLDIWVAIHIKSMIGFRIQPQPNSILLCKSTDLIDLSLVEYHSKKTWLG
jgi:hypothetical protein